MNLSDCTCCLQLVPFHQHNSEKNIQVLVVENKQNGIRSGATVLVMRLTWLYFRWGVQRLFDVWERAVLDRGWNEQRWYLVVELSDQKVDENYSAHVSRPPSRSRCRTTRYLLVLTTGIFYYKDRYIYRRVTEPSTYNMHGFDWNCSHASKSTIFWIISSQGW